MLAQTNWPLPIPAIAPTIRTCPLWLTSSDIAIMLGQCSQHKKIGWSVKLLATVCWMPTYDLPRGEFGLKQHRHDRSVTFCNLWLEHPIAGNHVEWSITLMSDVHLPSTFQVRVVAGTPSTVRWDKPFPVTTSMSDSKNTDPPPSPQEKQCRICLDGEDPELGRLIRPCLCKGSISVSIVLRLVK